MHNGHLVDLSYFQATRLGQPRAWEGMPRVPTVDPLRRLPPPAGTRSALLPRRWANGSRPALSGLQLGQAGANINLPDGSLHVVRAVNTTGEILTTSGWQSATQPDGSERWIQTQTGDVMLSDGSLVRAPGLRLPWLGTVNWWLVGGGVLAVVAVGYLATQGAPVVRRRGRAAWGAYRGAA